MSTPPVVTARMARRFTDAALAAAADTPGAAVAAHLLRLNTPERRARADYAARAIARYLGGSHSRRVGEVVDEFLEHLLDGREGDLLWGERVDAQETARMRERARHRPGKG